MVSDSPEPVLLNFMIHCCLRIQEPLMKIHMLAQLLYLLLAVRGTQRPEDLFFFFAVAI